MFSLFVHKLCWWLPGVPDICSLEFLRGTSSLSLALLGAVVYAWARQQARAVQAWPSGQPNTLTCWRGGVPVTPASVQSRDECGVARHRALGTLSAVKANWMASPWVWPALLATCVVSIPPLWFSGHLYYTDSTGLLFLLLAFVTAPMYLVPAYETGQRSLWSAVPSAVVCSCKLRTLWYSHFTRYMFAVWSICSVVPSNQHRLGGVCLRDGAGHARKCPLSGYFASCTEQHNASCMAANSTPWRVQSVGHFACGLGRSANGPKRSTPTAAADMALFCSPCCIHLLLGHEWLGHCSGACPVSQCCSPLGAPALPPGVSRGGQHRGTTPNRIWTKQHAGSPAQRLGVRCEPLPCWWHPAASPGRMPSPAATLAAAGCCACRYTWGVEACVYCV